jgi:hypothetical protein
MRALVCILIGLLAACRTSGSTKVTAKHPPVELPVVIEEDRFYLQTKTASGAELRMYLDSAGGMFLTRRAAERLRLPVKPMQTPKGEVHAAPFPTFYDGRLPRPAMEDIPVRDREYHADGMLGAPWFAGRVFTFDYGGKRLWLRSPGDLPEVPEAHRIPFGMQRDMTGTPTSPYGRIQMQVDGASIDMLFDTGATIALTDAALQQLGGAARDRATSFIIATVFDRWRKAHPEWRVIEAADANMSGAPLIEVPKVRIAGHDIGPVWFTSRPDENFREYMAELMDKASDGAIGGTALKYFQRVTVDWANGTAVFEK